MKNQLTRDDLLAIAWATAGVGYLALVVVAATLPGLYLSITLFAFPVACIVCLILALKLHGRPGLWLGIPAILSSLPAAFVFAILWGALWSGKPLNF